MTNAPTDNTPAQGIDVAPVPAQQAPPSGNEYPAEQPQYQQAPPAPAPAMSVSSGVPHQVPAGGYGQHTDQAHDQQQAPQAQQPPYQQQYQQQYQQPQPMYQAAPNPQVMFMVPPVVQLPPRGKSTASMWIGIVSVLFGFTFFLPLLGFILGILGYKREPAGRGMAVTGLILNGIFMVTWGLIMLVIIGGIIAGAAAFGSYGYSSF
jgi:hypothetical protein